MKGIFLKRHLAALEFFNLQPSLVTLVEGREFLQGDVDEMVEASHLRVRSQERIEIVNDAFL